MNGNAVENLTRWPEHAAFFDGTVRALAEARWIHPWMNLAAEITMNDRAAKATGLLGSAQVLDGGYTDWPNGEPGSEAEAQSYCLHLLTAGALRSLARSGLLAFAHLPLESVGIHRRMIETLLQIELLVDEPALAIDCWRLGLQMTPKDRKANPFLKRADEAWKRPNNLQNYKDADLTPLQRMLRCSNEDAALHLGPHAGVQHGISGMEDVGVHSFFDVRHRDVGIFAWRCATQMIKLCQVLIPKLRWVDCAKWEQAVDPLLRQSACIERADRARHGRPGKAPWSHDPT